MDTIPLTDPLPAVEDENVEDSDSSSDLSVSSDLVFDNVENGETVYQVHICKQSSRYFLTPAAQRCIILKAQYEPTVTAPSMVTVEQKSDEGDELYPPQTWPVAKGRTKIIAMLSPGVNVLHILPNSDATRGRELELIYTPNFRYPPLHLAIMIAADSPLRINHDPSKSHTRLSDRGSFDSAINKLRLTAYMWQAMIAEDMRMNGLQRRSFRLDEDWAIDTTSARFIHAFHQADLWEAGAARLTAKVHVLQSTHSTLEIQNAKIAQDNPHGKNKKRLHTWFVDALQASGLTIFTDSARPVVAGLIIDSTWMQEEGFALGHAALGSHNPIGLSLCVFGSHLTYAWPEHVEEIASYLTDARAPEEYIVSTANATTGSMWEICSIGQTEFLHQLGHAFGASHNKGIMKGGCAHHWPRHFVSRTAPDRLTGKEGIVVKEGKTANEATFDLKDLLMLSYLPQFRMPDDVSHEIDVLSARYMMPHITVGEGEDVEGNPEKQLLMSSPAGLVRTLWNGQPSHEPTLEEPQEGALVPIRLIEEEFSRDEQIQLAVLACNGMERMVGNLWELIADPSTIPIPGSHIVLEKRSVVCGNLEENPNHFEFTPLWRWATLLSKPMEHGTIARANEVDVCIGDSLLGLYVRFEDGLRVNCGPRFNKAAGGKYEKHFGGHIREFLMIPTNQEVVRFEIGRDAHALRGLKVYLSNGEVKGALSGGGFYDERCILGIFLNTLSPDLSVPPLEVWLIRCLRGAKRTANRRPPWSQLLR